jgi:hypothetical protein
MNLHSCCVKRIAGPRLCSISLAVAIAGATIPMAGCGGGSSGPTLSGNTTVVVMASSTANDELSQLSLYITGATLTNKEGKTVDLLSTPLDIEFMHLNGSVEPLVTVSVPQGVYTSAAVSARYGDVECATYESSDPAEVSTYGTLGISAANVTANLPEPITITGTGMGLELDLQVSQSTNYTSCPGLVNGPVAFSVTPTFNVTPVILASQPTDITNGKAIGLRGLIGSVASDGASFSVTGEFGGSASGPTWQVSSNASTVFQGIAGPSQLAAGLPVDMDVAIQPDGTLAATRIAMYDTNPATVSFSIGPVIYFGSPAPTVATQVLNFADATQGPDTGCCAWPYTLGNAVFQLSSQLANVSTLPFTARFDASSMVPGQNVFVTTHLATDLIPFPASTVTLLPQSIDGQVTAISSSGDFTAYTISLAPYDLFPNLAPLQGQVNTLTDPGSVVVYVDSNTQMLSMPAVGTVARFNGLVFNDNGTLRMDCVQVSDGVAE